MKEKEFNLSEWICKDNENVIHKDSVKEFIRRLKNNVPLGRCWGHRIVEEIDKLTGEDLI